MTASGYRRRQRKKALRRGTWGYQFGELMAGRTRLVRLPPGATPEDVLRQAEWAHAARDLAALRQWKDPQQ